ncbi:hypothetical protein IE994_23220 [Enterobacter hormaechei]|nr:hypothetical protein [Enterobacter hormaechei]
MLAYSGLLQASSSRAAAQRSGLVIAGRVITPYSFLLDVTIGRESLLAAAVAAARQRSGGGRRRVS